MKFLFDYRGAAVQVSLRGEHELKNLQQIGCLEFRAEPTGNWIATRNGKRKMETRGVEYVTTEAGRFTVGEWHRLLDEAVFCEEKTWLLSGAVVFGLVRIAFGCGTTLIVPLGFGKLSRSAVAICRSMVILMAAFMPLWVYMNTQQAVARAGGDTAMGAYADSLLTLLVMIPMVILLGKFTMIGPVGMYGCVKLIDLIKVVVFHIWLKKERWLKNLTGMESVARG